MCCGPLDCNPRPITHWFPNKLNSGWTFGHLSGKSWHPAPLGMLLFVWHISIRMWCLLHLEHKRYIKCWTAYFHILTLLWSKSLWLDERLGVWLRLVPWKIGLSPVQADWGTVTAGNSNVTPTLAVKNAQCPRGASLFMSVVVLYTGGTVQEY